MHEKNTRQANFEVLRILAMCMVVSLHYLNKGQVARSLEEGVNGVLLCACFLKALCIVAVNCYVFISGYFMPEASWKPEKLWRLVLQIWSYSLGVPLVCLLLGVGTVAEWGLYEWLPVLLPLQMEHYWFATAYVLLYLLLPILSPGVKKLSQKQLGTTIGLLLFFFSMVKSVLPVLVSTDRYGYDFGWFICLYLLGAYVRLYGIPFLQKKKNGFWCYLGVSLLLVLVNAVLGELCRLGLPCSYALDMTFSYNHILVTAAAIALCCGFSTLKLKEGRGTRLVRKLAPYTFGVYLLHENMAVRELWPVWFGIERVRDSYWFLSHMAVSVAVIFLAGVLTEYVRVCVTKVLGVWLVRMVKRGRRANEDA